jgi:hypothetical protein
MLDVCSLNSLVCVTLPRPSIYTDNGKATTMSLELPLVLRNGRLFDPITSTIPRVLEMLSKPPVPPVPTKSFHLSCLDQHVVRVYIQTLCIFPVCFSELSVVSSLEVDVVRSSPIKTPKMRYRLSVPGFASHSPSFPFSLVRSHLPTEKRVSLLSNTQRRYQANISIACSDRSRSRIMRRTFRTRMNNSNGMECHRVHSRVKCLFLKTWQTTLVFRETAKGK